MIALDDTFIVQLGELVRKGATESAAGIYNPTIKLLLPMCLQRWAGSIASQPAYRPLLQREFRVAIVNGQGDLPTADYSQLLKTHLRYSYGIIDNDQPAGTVSTDAEENADVLPTDTPGWSSYPAVFHQNYTDLQSGRYLDPGFDHYALRDRRLLVCQGDKPLSSGNFKLFASYVPDFGTKFYVPDELRDSLMASVATYLQSSQLITTVKPPQAS